MKSIHVNLDLGHGLTLAAYDQFIAETRAALEAYNTLLSQVEEARKTVSHMDKELSKLPTRMLSGVASRYGRDSVEYLKAGSSFTSRKSQPKAQQGSQEPESTSDAPIDDVFTSDASTSDAATAEPSMNGASV